MNCCFMENSKAIVNRSFLSFSTVVLNLCIRWEVILQHILPLLEKFSTDCRGGSRNFLSWGCTTKEWLQPCLMCLLFKSCCCFVLFCFFWKLLVLESYRSSPSEGGLGRGMCPPPIDTLLDFRFTFSSLRTQAFAGYTITDWLKNLAPVFQPTKTKTNRTLCCVTFVLPWEIAFRV